MFKRLERWDMLLSMGERLFWLTSTTGLTALTSWLSSLGQLPEILGWPLLIWLSFLIAVSITVGVYKAVFCKPPKIYQDAWTKLEVFTAWQAACLWAGEEPSLPIRHTTAPYPLLKLIVTADDENELPVYKKHEPGGAWPEFDAAWNEYRRTDLSAFARKKNLTPKFPF